MFRYADIIKYQSSWFYAVLINVSASHTIIVMFQLLRCYKWTLRVMYGHGHEVERICRDIAVSRLPFSDKQCDVSGRDIVKFRMFVLSVLLLLQILRATSHANYQYVYVDVDVLHRSHQHIPYALTAGLVSV